eukprot:COSAG02_NODE_4206_length_5626_cov_10.092619_5_plen_50_part_00
MLGKMTWDHYGVEQPVDLDASASALALESQNAALKERHSLIQTHQNGLC